MDKVLSIRGIQKVMHNGYVYVKQKDLAGGVISYECEKRRGNGTRISECKAKIKVKNDVVVGTLHEHTHASDATQCEVLQVRHNIKKGHWKQRKHPSRFLVERCKILAKQRLCK